jgi:indolepyruvate ferredoxin oxidoreductase
VAVVNSAEIPTGESVRRGIVHFGAPLQDSINGATRARANLFADASHLAEALFGTHMPANIFLAGVAYQAGYIPLSAASLERAIELNGVDAPQNLAAFRWGRKYCNDADAVESLADPGKRASSAPLSLDELIDRRARDLTAYQNARYAERYRSLVGEVRRGESAVRPGSTDLTEAVARYLYKLMAYKDEYEVARLLTKPEFDEQTRALFAAPRRVLYNLHPPLLRALGLQRKIELGPGWRPLLRALAALRGLRGTPLDLFGYAAVRRRERALIDWYQQTIRIMLTGLSSENLDDALAIARSPDRIRGYEQIKLRSIDAVQREIAQAVERFTSTAGSLSSRA